jgi:hypothetical protein
MDTNLLRSWLGLPPGSWPPDDRALLGLPTGPVDAAAAERRALELMGRLRPHQLVHPELVTEGMNRLAQALLAVTMGGPSPAPSAPAMPVRPAPEPAPALEPQAIALAAPPVVEAVPIAPEEPPSVRPVPARPVAPPPEPLPPVEVPEPPVVLEPEVGANRAERRRAYRELAGLRQLLRAWDRLRPTVADPSERLLTPGRVYMYLDGVTAVRSAAEHPGLEDHPLRRLAPLLAGVLLYPLPLAVFRDLTPSQRLAVARDWAMARALLEARIDALRVSLRRSAPQPGAGPLVAHTISFVGRNPEWVIVAATLALAAVAGVCAAGR